MSKEISLLLPMMAVLLSVTACQDHQEASPAPEPSVQQNPPVEVEQTPSASIIRPDITPEPVIDVPPPALETLVGFPEGGTKLDGAAIAELQRVLASDQMSRGWPIILRGNTDSVGNDEANLRASKKRAQAVADYLIDNGVDKSRIQVIALGEQRPLKPNAKLDGTPDEEGRKANRRVDVRIDPPENSEPATEPQKNSPESPDSNPDA
ncbi:OmpA family protein [Altererythrobacter indicus]|uniref:OmpA family protein n=1 Tax=Altericroceibacterium indicum TaxID=374177 RepID=A0A845AF21_9SPHN|nr:OmpA family protein [Altericroceibacterium indicum]MXP27156.1 OmpA family protein [Altericroceibacterium indicum]